DGYLMLSTKIENRSEEGRNDPYSYGKYLYTTTYTSGQVTTGDKGAWTYGRFEIRAKLPLGERSISYANLYSVDGKAFQEISILKMLGNNPYTIYVANRWGVDQPRHYLEEDASSRGYCTLDYSADFHIFAVEWAPGTIRWYIDDVEIYRTKRNVPDVPLSLSLETAVNYPIDNNSKISGRTISEPQYFTVDWFRVYRRK
ncbi:MAG TPA: glycoside hydrolase family 16 protein, partial [Bacillota bacterium]|nr:glycoside hydrolase family 16 protein [Bacillota bacterium]